MGKLAIGLIMLFLILGGLGTWLLWDFAYYSESRTAPNDHIFEKTVRAKHPNFTPCNFGPLYVLFDLEFHTDWVMQRAKRDAVDIYFASTPQEFAERFKGEQCLATFKVSYNGRNFAGQRAYLGDAGAGKLVAWQETYAPPPGWQIKAVSDDTITYNRRNGINIALGTYALWFVIYSAYAIVLINCVRRKKRKNQSVI